MMLWILGLKPIALAFLSRNGFVLALIVGGLVTFCTYDTSRVNHGRRLETAAIEKRADANAKKAERARRSVDHLPDDRLRDGYFRDR